MNSRALKILTVLFFVASFGKANDTIHFQYDQYGNRTDKRLIVMETMSAVMAQPQMERTIIKEDMEKAKITIFPNPSKCEVNVRMEGLIWNNIETQTWELSVFSTDGKVLLTKACYGPTGKINISTLSPGMYFIRILKDEVQKTYPLLKK